MPAPVVRKYFFCEFLIRNKTSCCGRYFPFLIGRKYPAIEKRPVKERFRFNSIRRISYTDQPPNCASMVPAATAVPITPATFGPIACISK